MVTYKKPQPSYLCGKLFAQNRFSNLLSMANSKPIAILKDKYKNKPVILVASGPSLSKNIDQLLSVKGKALIIACDSAVVPLINRGIIPDYITTVDFRAFTYKKLESVKDKLSDVYLIHIAESTPEIPNKIKFKGIYYTSHPDEIGELLKNILGESNAQQHDLTSVFHLALFSAQVFGCSPIVFVGLDLSISNGKDHVEGTVLDWGNSFEENSDSIYVKGIDGDLIHTLSGFVDQKVICEQLISSDPSLEYVDATEGGAFIQGTKVDKLSGVVDKLDKAYKVGIVEYTKTNPDYKKILYNLKLLRTKLLFLNRSMTEYNKHKKNINAYTPHKINKKIKKMNKITECMNCDETMFYMREIVVAGYGDYINLKGIEQQVFVQRLRFEAIMFYIGLVDRQIEVFSNLG